MELSISTSTSLGSICLSDKGSILFTKSWHRSRSHAEILTPSIDEAFTETGIRMGDLDLVNCDIGPGSFTGVRVAVSSAKTLAYSLDVPLTAFSSLRILAEAIVDFQKPVLSIINAQRQEVYGALYTPGSRGLKETLKPQLMSLDKLEKLLSVKTCVVGDGFQLLEKDFSKKAKSKIIRPSNNFDFPRTEILAKLGLGRKKLNKTLEWKYLEPLYIRLSAAEEKLAKGELKRHV